MEQTRFFGVDAAEIPDQVNQFFLERGEREPPQFCVFGCRGMLVRFCFANRGKEF
jgi:hypothetical protein